MKIMLKDVENVYVGKPDRCCCGCSGTYRYASAHAKAGSKRRGYKVEPEEINDRQVRKVVAALEAHPDLVSIHNGFVTADIDGKMMTAYFVRR